MIRVPVEELDATATRVRGVAESRRIVRLVLHCLEAGLRERTVVRDARAAQDAVHAELREQIDEACGGPRRPAIVAHRDAPRLQVVTRNRIGEEPLGESAVLPLRDHPGDRIAAEQVEHEVEVQEDAGHVGGTFADVPRPTVVGRGGLEARDYQIQQENEP